MFNLLLLSGIFVCSLSIFKFTYTNGKVINTINAFDFVYAQSAVHVPMNGDDPYFFKSEFASVVNSYFETNLKPYLGPNDDYSIGFHFKDILVGNPTSYPYIPITIPGLPLGNASEAGFTITCHYNVFSTYMASKDFVIEKGNNYEK